MTIFEICTTNIQSVLAAHRAGAHRVELCSALDAGGLTPSAGLIGAALRPETLPIYVLIRPREGNFCYQEAELRIMLDDIVFCREAGVQGVVFGALDARGRIDIRQMSAMVEAAGGMDMTCHRAFDFTDDPFRALETLVDLGIRRVLSSGQAATAHEGRFLLKQLVEKADGRITVMLGAGISARNFRELADVTGAREFHFTGRQKMIQPNDKNPIPGLEWWYWESNEAEIRKIMSR